MPNPIALPSDIVLAITTIKASGIDPNDFNNAVQELFNRGYGKQGKWIQDHKELFMQALQDSYFAEGSPIPVSEPTKNLVPPTHQAPANDPENASVVSVVETNEFPDNSSKVAADALNAAETLVDIEEPTAEEPEDKPHKRK